MALGRIKVLVVRNKSRAETARLPAFARYRFLLRTVVHPSPGSKVKILHIQPDIGSLPMSNSLVCWRCGSSLAALSLPLRRLDVCKACNAELHVCRMCVEYDTSKAKHCREPIAEEVRKKDEANFCDFFKPKAGAYVAKGAEEAQRAKAQLDDLFRK